MTSNDIRSRALFHRRGDNLVELKTIQGYVVEDLSTLADETNSLQAQITALVVGDIYDEVTAAVLAAKRTAGTLVPAKAYLITDLAEPLIIYALKTDKLGMNAYSRTYPQDIIVYNTSDALPANWKIIYRKDAINNLLVQGIDADFRTTPLFGAGCINIFVVNWNANTITIGANCSNLYIDMTLAGENITIGAGVTNKRLEEGFSNFESASIDINGLSTINLTGNKYCGIINLISSSDSDVEQIDIISNASGNHTVTLKSTDTLTINYRDLGISGGNLKLEASPTTTMGERHDFIVFEKDGSNMNIVNVRNYLPVLVSP